MAKTERRKLTDKLDGLIREIIRIRDDNKCQRCHKTIEGCNSHPCHVVATGRGASVRRWDLLNIFLGCMHCHRWWHNNPLEAADFFRKTFPARDIYLRIYRGGRPCPINISEMKDLVEVCKQKLKELLKEIEK